MILRTLIFISAFSVVGCSSHESADNPSSDKKNETSVSPAYQVVITQTNSGFGYQILKDGKLMIDQPTIPAIQGNQSFSTRELAQKTADYLVVKLKDGLFPPTLTVEELDSLGVLN